MASWRPTAADRGSDGKILLERPPDDVIRESLADVGAAAAPVPPRGGEAPADAPQSLRARIAGAVAALGVVAGLALIILGSRPATEGAPPVRSTPTAAPVPPTPSPTVQASHMIVAYWAPDGATVPEPIREADAYHFIGRLGGDWAQVQLPGGGVVWVRRAALHLDEADLAALDQAPDRTPPTPAPIIYAPPPAPVVVGAPATAAPEPPTPLAVPAMRFPVDAPESLPAPRRVGEKPSGKRPPPGTRAYGRVGPLQPPVSPDQPLLGGMPTEAPAPAGGQQP